MTAPSRRRFLTAGAGLLAAGATVADAATSATSRAPVPVAFTTAPSDPVLPMVARLREVEQRCADAVARHKALRAVIVARCGEPMLFDAAIFDTWEADPDHAELMAIDEECTRLGDAATELRSEIVSTPATSPAGALAKLQVALSLWHDGLRLEYHHEVTLDLLRDATRVLGGAA